MNEQLSQLIQTIFLPIVTAFVTWLFARKRNAKETEGLMLLNIEKAVSVYKEMLDDMRARYDAEIESLKQRLNDAHKHIEQLEAKFGKLR